MKRLPLLNYRVFEANVVLKSYNDRFIDMFGADALFMQLSKESNSREIALFAGGLCFRRWITTKGCHGKYLIVISNCQTDRKLNLRKCVNFPTWQPRASSHSTKVTQREWSYKYFAERRDEACLITCSARDPTSPYISSITSFMKLRVWCTRNFAVSPKICERTPCGRNFRQNLRHEAEYKGSIDLLHNGSSTSNRNRNHWVHLRWSPDDRRWKTHGRLIRTLTNCCDWLKCDPSHRYCKMGPLPYCQSWYHCLVQSRALTGWNAAILWREKHSSHQIGHSEGAAARITTMTTEITRTVPYRLCFSWMQMTYFSCWRLIWVQLLLVLPHSQAQPITRSNCFKPTSSNEMILLVKNKDTSPCNGWPIFSFTLFGVLCREKRRIEFKMRGIIRNQKNFPVA